MGKTYTTDEYVVKAKQVHGEKYDYSLVVYTHNQDRVTIVCPKHGEFTQIARSHVKGQGCKHCAHDRARGTKNVNRLKALGLGQTMYTGNPCVKGHTLRYTSNNSCYECGHEQRKVWRDANKERHKEMTNNWRKSNPQKVVESNYKRSVVRNRRFRDANVYSDRKEIRDAIEGIYSLAKEMRNETGVDLHVDHIIPLGATDICGLHVPWNLQIASAEYNCNKQNAVEYVGPYMDWKNSVMVHESALPWNLKETSHGD